MNYKMVDTRPVMEQFHEMLRILEQYVQHNLMMDEAISVAVIIDKLPPSWKDFKHSLKHKKEELNLIGSSSVNMVEGDGAKNSKNNKNNKNKRKFNGGGDNSANKKSTLVCWKCNKPDHMKKDCRSRKGNDGADGSCVKMGNVATEPIKGIRRVLLTFTSGKTLCLDNVLYVPGIRKNLVSEIVLNKCGYKQVLESDKYIFSRRGSFVGFGYVCNGMIRLNLNYPLFNASACMNRVAERKNRTLKDMVNSMLSYSGLSEGFWGEAMLIACYILNRNPNKNSKQTPYEIWTKKVPNLTYLRIWGCRAVVRLTEPKMKNLGEKESRDAIFDEERFTSIPRPRGMIQSSSSKIAEDEVEGSDDVPGPSVPRKSTRTRKAKSFGSNFQLYLVEGTRDKTLSQREYCFIIEEDPRTLRCKWILKRKMKVDGSIDKYKARLVIQGFRQKEGIGFFDTYDPVARISTIRLLLALAAIHDLVIHQMDVKNAFLNGDLDEEIYMKQPEGFVIPGHESK
nr:hypothetical protein [Tanacetum cinerariifolium]